MFHLTAIFYLHEVKYLQQSFLVPHPASLFIDLTAIPAGYYTSAAATYAATQKVAEELGTSQSDFRGPDQSYLIFNICRYGVSI